MKFETNPIWDPAPYRLKPCRDCEGHGVRLSYPNESTVDIYFCYRCKGTGEDRDTWFERLKKWMKR